jgi:hypothetical protein
MRIVKRASLRFCQYMERRGHFLLFVGNGVRVSVARSSPTSISSFSSERYPRWSRAAGLNSATPGSAMTALAPGSTSA